MVITLRMNDGILIMIQSNHCVFSIDYFQNSPSLVAHKCEPIKNFKLAACMRRGKLNRAWVEKLTYIMTRALQLRNILFWIQKDFRQNCTIWNGRKSSVLNGRFSLNFPDSCMAIRWIICTNLGEFLCAKLEISFKTQENISKWYLKFCA